MKPLQNYHQVQLNFNFLEGYFSHVSLNLESQAEQDARTVFVVGLPTTATERDLKPFFEQAGKVKVISLISDRNSRRSKGSVFKNQNFNK